MLSIAVEDEDIIDAAAFLEGAEAGLDGGTFALVGEVLKAFHASFLGFLCGVVWGAIVHHENGIDFCLNAGEERAEMFFLGVARKQSRDGGSASQHGAEISRAGIRLRGRSYEREVLKRRG